MGLIEVYKKLELGFEEMLSKDSKAIDLHWNIYDVMDNYLDCFSGVSDVYMLGDLGKWN